MEYRVKVLWPHAGWAVFPVALRIAL